MKYAVAVLLLGVTLRSAQASCPNACSGNGACTDYDSCVCYRNFMGGDCSQRVCPFDYAWVTTPNGDLNFDGDILDGTYFADDHLLSTDGNSLTTQAAPGGTWEQWPGTASAASDEGHFYMECSNKGLCDRATGQCQCFDGYTGVGCKRTTCPENCNGHGACKTINQLKTGTYQLWDGDKDRSCVCDPGYSGPTCMDRDCPKGDDPLTKTHQVSETQYVDIRATCTPDQTSTSNCRDRATNSGTGLDGRATLTFTDAFGEEWTTDSFDVEAYTGATTAATAAAVKTALEALPNDVIGTVTVTAGFCEVPAKGVYDNYMAGTGAGAEFDNWARCPTGDDGGVSYTDVVAKGTSKVVYHSDTSTAAAGVAADLDSTNDPCYEIQYPECIRFAITFDTQPGDITDLSVDVTEVTMNGATNAMDSTVLITAAVSDSLSLNVPITAANAGVATYTAPAAFTGVTTSAWAGDLMSFTLASTTHGAYPVNAEFSLACDSKELGVFTLSSAIAAVSGATSTVAFNEAITSSQNVCDTNAALLMVMTPTSNYIATDTDLTGYANLVGKALSLNGVSANGVVESVAYAGAIGTIFLNSDGIFSGSDVTTGALLIVAAGTKENNECSDRGICDRLEGLCKCFKGYNGDACETQNALAA